MVHDNKISSPRLMCLKEKKKNRELTDFRCRKYDFENQNSAIFYL